MLTLEKFVLEGDNKMQRNNMNKCEKKRGNKKGEKI